MKNMNYLTKFSRLIIQITLSGASLFGSLTTHALLGIFTIGNLSEPAISTLESNDLRAAKTWLIMIKSEQDPNKKLEKLDRLIKTFPRFAEAYYERGSIRYGLGDTIGSEKDYELAAKYYLVSIRSLENNFYNPKALPILDKVITFSPDNICAYYYRGKVQESNSNIEEAIENFTHMLRSIKNDPSMSTYLSEAYEIRGDLHAKSGNYKYAIRDYDRLELAVKRREISVKDIKDFCELHSSIRLPILTLKIPTEKDAQSRLANVYYKRGKTKIKKDKTGARTDLNKAWVIFSDLNDETNKQKVKETLNLLN
jgi:tetratricopeptide (TPR) repeat protein